ncbi:hypothetical protein Tco_0622597 [Tanacetum coccineum]
MELQSETTQTVSTLKLPVLKNREYDLWSMRMEQYLTFTDRCPLGRMQSPYAKLSRIGLEATRNQRRCRRLFSSRIIKTLLHQVKMDWIKPMIAWETIIALIMRNNSDLDTLSMDDLYNNLKVTNQTFNIAHSVSATSSKDQASTASYANDIMFSFFVNQSNTPQLDNEDLE